MEIVIHGLKNLSDKQQNKIRSSMANGGLVLDSHLFQTKVIQAKYKESKGLNGEEILKMILSGADDNERAIDGDIDIDIQGFFRLGSTIGYTYLGSFRQYINRRFLDKFSEGEVFGHVMHELMHRAYGFVHRKSHAGTVPYNIGYFARDAYQELYSEKNHLMVNKSFFASETNQIWKIRFA